MTATMQAIAQIEVDVGLAHAAFAAEYGYAERVVRRHGLVCPVLPENRNCFSLDSTRVLRSGCVMPGSRWT